LTQECEDKKDGAMKKFLSVVMIVTLILHSVTVASLRDDDTEIYTQRSARMSQCADDTGSVVCAGILLLAFMAGVHLSVELSRPEMWHVSILPAQGFSWNRTEAPLFSSTHILPWHNQASMHLFTLLDPLRKSKELNIDYANNLLKTDTTCLYSDLLDICFSAVAKNQERTISVMDHSLDCPCPANPHFRHMSGVRLAHPGREWAFMQSILFQYADICRGARRGESDAEARQPKICLLTALPFNELNPLVSRSLHLRSLECASWKAFFGDAVVIMRRHHNGTLVAQTIQNLHHYGLNLYEDPSRVTSMLHRVLPCE